MDERTFGYGPAGKVAELRDYLLKLPHCPVDELVMEVSAEDLKGVFKCYGGKT